MLGEQYAQEKGYELETYPADWKKYGRRAGFLRNEQMADLSNAAIGFWDGDSHGTQHMIEYSKEKGLDVRVVRYNG